jgi:hypothetical protein
MFEFSCPHCDALIHIDEKHRGKKGRCKVCAKDLLVPVACEEGDDFLGACLSDSYNTEEASQERQDKAAANSRHAARSLPPRMIEEKKKPGATGWVGLIGVVVISVMLYFYFAGGAVWQARSVMGQIEREVAEDAVERYEIAKRSGSAIDAYVQAGLVCAAYLQAKDEQNYQKWKKIEAEEARRAGMPTP